MLAGILLSPFALVMMIASPFSGWLSDKYGVSILSSVGLFISSEAMQGIFVGTQVGFKGIATSQFIAGLRTAFTICFIFSILAAFMSYLRGPNPVWKEEEEKVIICN